MDPDVREEDPVQWIRGISPQYTHNLCVPELNSYFISSV